jgi:hypothetical protein
MTRFTDAIRQVDVRLTESLSRNENGKPVMVHRRLFTNALSDRILSLLLGLKFYGEGGLMVDSTAESEEDSLDGSARFVRRFTPLGAQFASALAGCFHVHQELIECTQSPKGILAAIKMTFSPSRREGSAAERWFSLADRAGGIRGKPRRSLDRID